MILCGPWAPSLSDEGARLPCRVAADLRRCLAAVVAAGAALLCLMGSSQAWDAGRMRAAAATLGPAAGQAARELEALLAQAPHWDEAGRLEAVNRHFNRSIVFAEDTTVWHQTDYWASPLEALARGEGDCEDYAIGKYFALAAAGIPVARLRLVYVRAQRPPTATMPARAQAHMVLAYYAGGADEPHILDNLVGDIRPASLRTDLTPVFSFNTEGLWQGSGKVVEGDPLARLSRWRDVVRKASTEGWL
jgi:predicted transglutaminase-like cysteine proteinase